MTSPEWKTLALAQDGVLARGQGLRTDLSEDAWQWQRDRRLWTALLPGVMATHSGTPTRNQQRWASVLRAGAGAALAGDAVLEAHGFPFGSLDVLHVAVPDRTAGVAMAFPDGVRYVPRSVSGLTDMVVHLHGLPVMNTPYAVLFAAAWAPSDRAAEWRLATSVQRGLAHPDQLRTTLRELPYLHRRALIATALDDVGRGAHALSELDFLRVVRQHQLPEPDELQVRVRTGSGLRFLDGRYRRQRVRFEVDGAHHRYVETWEADALRGNDLAILGRGSDEICLRFTGSQVRHQGAQVAAQLRAAFAA
jgi:very-short-patch-repair endonuclease